MSSAIKMVLCPVSLLDLLLVLCHFSSPFTRYPQPPARSYVRTLETLLYFVAVLNYCLQKNSSFKCFDYLFEVIILRRSTTSLYCVQC